MRRDLEGISDPSNSDDEVERAQPSSRAMPVKVVLFCYVHKCKHKCPITHIAENAATLSASCGSCPLSPLPMVDSGVCD